MATGDGRTCHRHFLHGARLLAFLSDRAFDWRRQSPEDLPAARRRTRHHRVGDAIDSEHLVEQHRRPLRFGGGDFIGMERMDDGANNLAQHHFDKRVFETQIVFQGGPDPARVHHRLWLRPDHRPRRFHADSDKRHRRLPVAWFAPRFL